MCTVLEFCMLGTLAEDKEIISAVHGFGFRAEGSCLWRQPGGQAVLRVDGYAAHGEMTCCCYLADDPDGLVRLRGLLEFLLPRCAELYYAPNELCPEEPAREITPAAVHGAYRPGTITPWGRVKMPEHFARGLSHLVRMMRDAGVEALLDYAEGKLRFRVPGLGLSISGLGEIEVARELLAALTWLWAEYGTAADGVLSADAVELKRKVLALVRAGVI